MKKKIIIVEDDPFSQNFYKLIFTKSGYEPIILEDADEVINRISNEKISLVIMDVNLKNTYLLGKTIDGSMLSRLIKSNENFRLPVILVTAFSPTITGNVFFEDSLADDCIIKPILDYNKLLQTIKELIDKYGS